MAGELQQHSSCSTPHNSSLQSLWYNARHLCGEAAAVQRQPKTTQQQTAVVVWPCIWARCPSREFEAASQPSRSHSSSPQSAWSCVGACAYQGRPGSSSSAQTAAVLAFCPTASQASNSCAAVQKIHPPAQGSSHCCPGAFMSSAETFLTWHCSGQNAIGHFLLHAG